jgi:hypothetical protein
LHRGAGCLLAPALDRRCRVCHHHHRLDAEGTAKADLRVGADRLDAADLRDAVRLLQPDGIPAEMSRGAADIDLDLVLGRGGTAAFGLAFRARQVALGGAALLGRTVAFPPDLPQPGVELQGRRAGRSAVDAMARPGAVLWEVVLAVS